MTLQDKIDKIFKTSEQGCGDSYSNQELVDKAIQELREKIKTARKESDKRWKTDKGEGELIAYDHVLSLIGEKK